LLIADRFLDNKLPSTTAVHVNIFAKNTESSGSPSQASCQIHSNADRKIHDLTSTQRDAIFDETHNHDGCYKAIAMYQHFFELCPPGQKLSIQIAGEEPVLVDLFPRQILEFKIQHPKLLSVTQILPGKVLVTGGQEDALHAVSLARSSCLITKQCPKKLLTLNIEGPRVS
jgi:hypothetical protein